MNKIYYILTISLILISCSGNKIQSSQNVTEPIKDSTHSKIRTIEDSIGDWRINNYIDEFDEKTTNQYIALKSEKGIFSTPGTTDSDLDVVIAVDKEHTEIRLFKHRGDYQTKLNGYIDFKIKDSNGEVHDIITLDGCTFERNVNTTDSLFKAILSRGGEIKFAATVTEYGNETKYNFSIPDADHFIDALTLINKHIINLQEKEKERRNNK